MRKILFISDNLVGGGKERRMVELIKGLDQQKNFDLHLITLEDKVYYKDIFETQCKLYRLSRSKGYELSIQLKLWRSINQINPDIIHYWGEVSMVYLIPISLCKSTPLVSSIIADTSPKKGFLKVILRKYSFLNSQLILSNTFLGLRNYRAPVKKSKVIYNGFDFSRLKNLKAKQQIRQTYKIHSEVIVMMVGSYNSRKDYKTFLKATEKLIERGIDVTAITAGYGDPQCLREFISPKNKSKYRFLSFQEDIESIMNVADIGILCSNNRKHGEGISNALLEFMALGKPVVATNYGGNKELIEDRLSGFLVPYQDVDFLADKLQTLALDKNLTKSMGKRSKEIIVEKFSIAKMISNFSSEYQELFS